MAVWFPSAWEDRIVRLRTRGDLYFVLASCLICLAILFSIIMPKVQANRAVRERLRSVVANTTEILRNVRAVAKRTQALSAGDPFFTTASIRGYLELQGRPWVEPEEGKCDAGDPEPGRS